jgi:hypothetical protein
MPRILLTCETFLAHIIYESNTFSGLWLTHTLLAPLSQEVLWGVPAYRGRRRLDLPTRKRAAVRDPTSVHREQ